MAAYFFIAGVLLCMVCGLRLNVRVLRKLGAWQPGRHPITDYITGELERIRLRDTVGSEIAGLVVGLIAIAFAIPFLQPA